MKTNLPHSVPLRCAIPASVERALQTRMNRTGESLDEAVGSCLAEALDVEQHSIFQVSTSGGLVQGVYQEATTMGCVKKHGDFGLGTFVGLDGEGIMLDGVCYRAGSDGRLSEVPDSTASPFWVTTRFFADYSKTLEEIQNWADLCSKLSALRPSENLLAAIRIKGRFDFIHVRVACKAFEGANLVEATSHQAEFQFESIEGTLVGFYTPPYARTINVPGYHLHFLSADHQHGGHVLELHSRLLLAELHTLNDLHVVLPENAAFLHADLNADPAAALAQAENARR